MLLHPASATGVIVLTSCVCPSVCLCVTTLQPKRQTYRPELWHVGQVEGYLGQVWRSRSKVKGQGHQVFSSDVKLLELQWGRHKPGSCFSCTMRKTSITSYAQQGIYSTPYMNCRAATRGVFKAYVFFCLFWAYREASKISIFTLSSEESTPVPIPSSVLVDYL